jgi:hypothetical protein
LKKLKPWQWKCKRLRNYKRINYGWRLQSNNSLRKY